MTDILYTFENPVSLKHLQRAQSVLEDGGIVAYPTDVNWACGCLCHHKGALEKLQKLRGDKKLKKPTSFLFSSLSQLSTYAEVDGSAYRVLKKILPGPYTVILASHKRLPKIIQDKRKEIGARIPDSQLLLELTALLDSPMATISLSLPTSESQKGSKKASHTIEPVEMRPRFGHEIVDAYPHLIDLVLDLSTEVIYQETSVIRLVGGSLELVRQGDAPLSPLLRFS